MADYTDSKSFGTKAYPVEAFETTNLLGRTEAIVTPEQLVDRHLKGVKLDDFTNENLKDQINLAINKFELLTNLYVNKVQMKERLPFDRALYKQFVYVKVNNGPILSVEDMSVVSSNGDQIYKLPATWIETGFSHKRQLNLIPILSIFGAVGLSSSSPSNAGLIFLNCIQNYVFLPAFWTVIYTVGVSHTEGQIPIVINNLIGIMAAIEILGIKQNQFLYNSVSISQDGLSQASGSQGTLSYQNRITNLMADRDKLLAKLKSKIGASKYFLSNI